MNHVLRSASTCPCISRVHADRHAPVTRPPHSPVAAGPSPHRGKQVARDKSQPPSSSLPISSSSPTQIKKPCPRIHRDRWKGNVHRRLSRSPRRHGSSGCFSWETSTFFPFWSLAGETACQGARRWWPRRR